MTRFLARLALIAAIPFVLSGCSAGALVAERQSMPAARASLLPEYRIFFDSLQDYGDWVLIEPYGYVFRPRVNAVAWKPYLDGFWAPTDLYGWVWISSEPFGWATYHYGTWFVDRFQGWVWVPGADWGPSWVNWQGNDQYVGWAPQAPRNAPYSSIPADAYNFVPVSQMGSTGLKSKVVINDEARKTIGATDRVENTAEIDGVTINRGPKVDWVERKAGPINRVQVRDLIGQTDISTLREREEARRNPASPAADRGLSRAIVSADSARTAADVATREARGQLNRGSVSRVTLVRPFGVAGRPTTPPRLPQDKTAADSTRAK